MAKKDHRVYDINQVDILSTREIQALEDSPGVSRAMLAKVQRLNELAKSILDPENNHDIEDPKPNCCRVHHNPNKLPRAVMYLCKTCGNKRCPRATNCELECTGSNEPGQAGSDYE